MKQFTIKELERFSGIKAHTIRSWEQRHFFFTPQRTEANLRRYGLEDLRLLLDISLLVKNGYQISRLAGVLTTETAQKTALLKDKDARQGRSINDLIYCMYSTNIEEFDQAIEGALLSWGLDLTIREIIIPFLEKVQLLSYKDNSTEAHLVVTAIRRKLILGIESLNAPVTDSRTALLFLPKGEHYDLMLLYIYYILKRQGFKPLYLGTNISAENMEKMCIEKKPSLLFSYTYPQQAFKLQEYSIAASAHVPDAILYIIYAQEQNAALPTMPNVRFVSYMELEGALKKNQ